MACPACGRNFHAECENGNCTNCHPNEIQLTKSITQIGTGRGAPIKDESDVKDRLSTGRKRAAVHWPLFKDQPCEWQGKKNCGGGKNPIVGCLPHSDSNPGGLQVHRHHGPVKDPIHNEPGNVHRICNNCHARWHALNDSVYNKEEYILLPHIPEIADEIELLANEAYWRVKR